MGGRVPSSNSGHRSARFCHNLLFIKKIHLFPLHLQLSHTPPLIPKSYDILFPPAHDF